MGEELLSDSPKTYTEIFEQQFPYYLAMGMTAQDYWHSTTDMHRAYRKADAIRRDRINHEAWLNGAYIYSALCAASPLFNSMSKQKKAFPYCEKPYEAPKKEKKKSRREQEREEMVSMREQFRARMEVLNAQFLAQQKSGESNGG